MNKKKLPFAGLLGITTGCDFKRLSWSRGADYLEGNLRRKCSWRSKACDCVAMSLRMQSTAFKKSASARYLWQLEWKDAYSLRCRERSIGSSILSAEQWSKCWFEGPGKRRLPHFWHYPRFDWKTALLCFMCLSSAASSLTSVIAYIA
jgi:hypothetical protein